MDSALRVFVLQRATKEPQVTDLLQANKLVRTARAGARHHLCFVLVSWDAIQFGGFHDAALANRAGGSSHGVICLVCNERAHNEDTKH